MERSACNGYAKEDRHRGSAAVFVLARGARGERQRTSRWLCHESPNQKVPGSHVEDAAIGL